MRENLVNIVEDYASRNSDYDWQSNLLLSPA